MHIYVLDTHFFFFLITTCLLPVEIFLSEELKLEEQERLAFAFWH